MGHGKRGRGRRWLAAALLAAIALQARAGLLDEAARHDPVLAPLAAIMASEPLDFAANLNDRAVVRQRMTRPRLGRFADLPSGRLSTGAEIMAWEAALRAGEIGGLALLGGGSPAVAGGTADMDDATYLSRWLEATADHRLLISFAAADRETAAAIAGAAASLGYAPRLLAVADGAVEIAGPLYATAAQRLALDSRAARRYRSGIPEFALAGKRLRRNSDSVFRAARERDGYRRDEPAVFLKETLGDALRQATIREIVVPGGVALGETATLPMAVAALEFTAGRLRLTDGAGQAWQLPSLDLATQRALFDFAQRAERLGSDAMVDIDGRGRVRISAALRDTDAGHAIMHADTQPFAYLQDARVSARVMKGITKSVVIDTEVAWRTRPEAQALTFAVDFEVRFLSADIMRIAQTNAALAYAYDADSGTVAYRDSWGRDAGRLGDDLDYAALGASVSVVARYGGWVGLYRKLIADGVPFLKGRYEFLTLDKAGRATPARYGL